MSIEQQIEANEETFRKWFHRSWDAHHKENPTASDFSDVGDPRPATRQKSYDYLDKRTIRIIPDLQSKPDAFVQMLQDYLINNALLLYQDSIRIASLPGALSFYKDCGNQVGMVECHLSREGQIVTVAIGYQIYNKAFPLTIAPSITKNADNSQTAKKGLNILLNESRNKTAQWISTWILLCFFFLLIALLCIGGYRLLISKYLQAFPDGLRLILALLLFLMGFTSFFLALFQLLFGLFFALSNAKTEKKGLALKIESHESQDLSHKFFPVACYTNDEVTAARSENKDHAAFLERFFSVVERAVALGESSHNQRS